MRKMWEIFSEKWLEWLFSAVALVLFFVFLVLLGKSNISAEYRATAILLLGLLFWFKAGKIRGVSSVEALGMKWVFDKLESADSAFKRKELHGLTAHDIWALDKFKQPQNMNGDGSNLATKVVVKSFLELGMVENVNEKYVVTEFGKKILDAADSIM